MEKREHSYTVGGNANWYSHYGEQCGDSFKLEIELPYDPEIPLQGIHTEEARIERDTCPPPKKKKMDGKLFLSHSMK